MLSDYSNKIFKMCLNLLLNDTFYVGNNLTAFKQSFNSKIFASQPIKIVDTSVLYYNCI